MSDSRPERRAFDASLRANGKRSISGHASVFNTEYDVGPFREVIRPGAFAESIKQDDIRALWGHDANTVLGRNKAGTLLLKEDSVGLAFVIDAPSWAEPQLETIRRGDVTQASFAFTVDGSDGENFQRGQNGEKDLRIITKARLWDVSPVTYPASGSTDVSVRALETYETWRSRPRRSLSWYRKTVEAMEADVERDRLRHQTKRQPSKPPRPAPVADGRVVLRGRQLATAVKDHRVEARKTADHESGHIVVMLFEGVNVQSARLLWRKKWGKYTPAGGDVTTRGRSPRESPASYVVGLISEDRRGLGWRLAAASRSDLSAVRRLTPNGFDEWHAQDTAKKVLKVYHRAFQDISGLLLRDGELSGDVCREIFGAERVRLKLPSPAPAKSSATPAVWCIG